MANIDRSQKNISLRPETQLAIDGIAKQERIPFYSALLRVAQNPAKYAHIDLTPPPVGQRGKQSGYVKAGLNTAETARTKEQVVTWDKESHKTNVERAIQQTLSERNTKRSK